MEIVAVVGGDDDQSFVPGAVSFDPVGDCFNGEVSLQDRTDAVVEVVVVVGPIDITRFNHEPEALRVG